MLRYDSYRVKRGDNLAASSYWNPKLQDIDNRLDARERDAERLNEAIDAVQSVALSRLNDVFSPLLLQAETRLSNFAALFSATSTSEATIGLGAKYITIPADERDSFVFLDYVVVRAVGHAASMTARIVSFERSTGILNIDAVVIEGSGTYSNWTLGATAAPDLSHATRTDNPHATTAAQVGAYTTGQVDALIAPLAPLNGPSFTGGTTTTPANPADNSTRIPTCGWVLNAVATQTPGLLEGYMQAASNLSDVANKPAARHSLGLGTADDVTFRTGTFPGTNPISTSFAGSFGWYVNITAALNSNGAAGWIKFGNGTPGWFGFDGTNFQVQGPLIVDGAAWVKSQVVLKPSGYGDGPQTNSAINARGGAYGGVYGAYPDVSQGISFLSRIDRTDQYHALFQFGYSSVGYIWTDGSHCYYTDASDARIKSNIRDYAVDWSGFMALQTRVYNVENLDGEQVGWVAQEAVNVRPNVVVRGDDNPVLRNGDDGFKLWGVDPSKLVPELCALVQDLQKRLLAAEAKIAELTNG